MNNSWKISGIISIVMLIGILFSSFFVFKSYSVVIKDGTKNIAELSSMNIYSEINNELTKPIYVSITMASDTFLKNWLKEELSNDKQDIVEYLNGVKDEYGYNSVFLISSETQNYYHFDGIHKKVSLEDEHDVWYYNFLEENNIYNLDVDVDEATSELTIFVNVKVYNENNNLIAVVGVGLEMEYIQEIMSEFENTYDLDVYLVNYDGLIQSNTNTDLIEEMNVFNIIDKKIRNNILDDLDDLVTLTSNEGKNYIISRYIDEIDWYLIVTKDTNLLNRFLVDYFIISILMTISVISFVSFIVIKTINGYQNKVYKLAKTDYMTLLLNRRGFTSEFEKFDVGNKEGLVFITDIDRFKVVNDKYGHTIGDEVLRRIALLIDNEVDKYGKLSRWGGDEFTGIMIGDRKTLELTLKKITSIVQNDPKIKRYNVTISVGYTYTSFDEDLDYILTKADNGLYESKAKGGNTITFIK